MLGASSTSVSCSMMPSYGRCRAGSNDFSSTTVALEEWARSRTAPSCHLADYPVAEGTDVAPLAVLRTHDEVVGRPALGADAERARQAALTQRPLGQHVTRQRDALPRHRGVQHELRVVVLQAAHRPERGGAGGREPERPRERDVDLLEPRVTREIADRAQRRVAANAIRPADRVENERQQRLGMEALPAAGAEA